MTKVQDRNNLIDSLLQKRQDGIIGFANATIKLKEMGVKIGNSETGDIDVPKSFEQYLDQYNESNLEFEWLAGYSDGTKLAQFDETGEHNFKDIDQTKLETISFVSNFNWPTDNIERRIIVTLHMKSGLFDIFNGFASQETKAVLMMNEVAEPKDLILFAKKRISSTVGNVSDDIKQFFPNPNETFYYNQFILGFKTPSGIKRAALIQPNGHVELFED